MSEDKKPRTRYRTTNWPQYNAALKARGSLTVWLDKDMRWLAQPSGKRGRDQIYSDAAIEFCLSIQCLFNQPLRQALGMVQSLLELAQLDWRAPDFSTVCRRQKALQVALKYRPSAQPLNLLVDSTGIKFLGEGEWKRLGLGSCRAEFHLCNKAHTRCHGCCIACSLWWHLVLSHQILTMFAMRLNITTLHCTRKKPGTWAGSIKRICPRKAIRSTVEKRPA